MLWSADTPGRRRLARRLRGGLAGLAAGGLGVGASEVVAARLTGVTSPVIAVADRIIDQTPHPVKELAIRELGTRDKPVLLASVLVGMAVGLVLAGVVGVEVRRRGVAVFVALAVVAAVFVSFDRASTASVPVRLVPVVVLVVVACAALWWLLGLLRDQPTEAPAPAGFDRRSFLLAVTGVGTVAAGSVVAGETVLQLSTGRNGVRLPRAAFPAPPIPRGAELHVPGLTPYITPNADFYRVDIAVRTPRLDVDSYRLSIGGMVEGPIELSFADLLDMPLVEKRVTLTCVSQPIGGPYVGNATWLGVRVRDLLARVGVRAGADAVRSTGADGMTIGTPLAALTDGREALVALGMNGEPLPLAHGFPVRLVVPGLYGYVSATKWLTALEVTRFADFKAYWTTRGYDAQAPIKTGTRIDVPGSFARLAPGTATVAGVSWAQDRGIERVEVRVDGGPWHQATLAAEDSIDTWRQWVWRWPATPGIHLLEARATDATGVPQTGARVGDAPNGATGWPSVSVTVTG